MSNIYHITTQLGRMDSFFLEADTYNDCINLISDISEADIINIKKVIYSKRLKIATNEPENLYLKNEDSIYKWSFFCYSNNYSKQIDLYNIRPTTTKEDIQNFLKTQLIGNEQIVGFYDDVKTDFKDTLFIDNNLFQVVYKYNSRTYTENLYSNNIEQLKKFFDLHIAGELIEIREFEYTNISTKEDKGNYYKRVSFKIWDNIRQFTSFIPNIKKTKNLEQIKTSIKTNLKFNNLPINEDNINYFLKS